MIGIYYTEDLMQKWFIENLPIARRVLSNFKSLTILLESFKKYETRRYRNLRNAVMFMCLPVVRGGLDSESIKRLALLEKTIELFDVMNWGAKKLHNFKSRLASQKYVQSLSVVTELEVAYRMVEKFGRPNVELYPELISGGFSDICVKVNNKATYLEVGNLGESLPQSKIQQILNASARYLGEKITSQCYLCLIIDTAELVFDGEGKIDVNTSIRKLNSEIDMLKLHKLAGFNGYFRLDDIAYIVANRSLYKKMKQWLTPLDQRLVDLIDDEKIKNWLNNFDSILLEKTRLIKSIIAGTGTNTLLVEIHTEDFFPSKAAMSERESFLNQIVRNIETQVAEYQLQPNTPNIIAIQGFLWSLHFGFADDLTPLYTRIKEFFRKKEIQYLSGVAVWSRKLEEAVYISNDYATEFSRLDEGNISQLGFRWLAPQ